MDDKLRQQLHDLTLQARHDLITETRDMLEGVYGLHADGRLEPAVMLPALQSLPEAIITRARLESLLHDEQAAGLGGREAVDALVKEVAFTHLNRLVAFKLLESRRLIRGTLDRYHDSNAFKFYLADPDHADELTLYEQGDFPQNALGEGPRDTAYRHFLFWQSAQMAREIKVLFDPETLTSRLLPRPRVLKSLVEALNAPAIQEAWAPGNEETIGWVYQYFNEQEKADVFERLNKQKKKVQREDIPAATQLFTPRWIVKFLVQNTLGRMWMQMHPDSRLAGQLDYLVPLGNDCPDESLKLVRDITLLDPACGTMHFGLVAFDLLAEMYREEIECRGMDGWPVQPSVATPEEIGPAIIAHNLFGIDIDLRAVQLSALTLLIKAKALNPKSTVQQSNLACADVTLLNGNRLNDLLSETQLAKPIYERILRALWPRLRDANQLGSLLRIEQEIQTLVEQERKAHAADLPLFPNYERFGDAYDMPGDFWTTIGQRIIEGIDAFAHQQSTDGHDETLFVGEAAKGMRLLDVLMRRYDIVVTNPPYLSNRNINSVVSDFLKNHYPVSKSDLYAAFIERCGELLNEHGRLGMITQQSFMFISSYEHLRGQLMQSSAIETLAHLGTRAFGEIGGEKVNTTAFVLRREPDELRRISSRGTYFRLVKEPDAEAKRLRFEYAIEHLKDSRNEGVIYYYRQGGFPAIPSAPWVYWITSGLRQLFKALPALGTVAQPRQGLATADNFRFLRYWWEVSKRRIDFDCIDRFSAMDSTAVWFPYVKGGSFRRWYGNREYVIQWKKDGNTIRNTSNAVVRNPNFYFRPGITYSHLASGPISFRLLVLGSIFDQAGSSFFPEDIKSILGICNSTFVLFAKQLINPSINFQVGSLGLLPMPNKPSVILSNLVERAVTLAKIDSEESETTYDFIVPPSWATGLADMVTRRRRLVETEHEIDEEVYRLYNISDEDRAAIEAELADPTALVDEDEESTASLAEAEVVSELSSGALSQQDLARRWVSYTIGIVLGRFQPGIEGGLGHGTFSAEVATQLRALVDADSIVVLEPGHPDALRPKVERALELMLGHDAAAEVLALATGGKLFDDYIAGEWWKIHVKDYRKRPIYWLVQSPKRSYSLLVFHERLTADSLYLIRGTRYLQGKLNGIHTQVADMQAAVRALPPGRERKTAEKELDRMLLLLTELEEFSRILQEITGRMNERGEAAGWRPELDDGVLLNLAPLYQLLPSWNAEPKKAWDALARGAYDWSYTAMRYWPDRVLAECRTNKSFAIAHGLDRDDNDAD